MEQEKKRKNIWAGIVSDAAYAGAKAMHDREQTQLRTAMKSQNVLTEITVDRDTTELLDKLGYTLETVPQKEEVVAKKGWTCD